MEIYPLLTSKPNHSSTFHHLEFSTGSKLFEHFRLNGVFTDVVLVLPQVQFADHQHHSLHQDYPIPNKQPHQVRFKAHKVILAAGSLYFRKLFTVENTDREKSEISLFWGAHSVSNSVEVQGDNSQSSDSSSPPAVSSIPSDTSDAFSDSAVHTARPSHAVTDSPSSRYRGSAYIENITISPRPYQNRLKPEIFETLLRFLYTNFLDIKQNTVFDLLLVANYFQMQDAEYHILDWLDRHLVPENTVPVYQSLFHFDDLSTCQTLKTRAWKLMLANFYIICKLPDIFLTLSEDTLISLLQSPALVVSSSQAAWNAVDLWIQAHQDIITQHSQQQLLYLATSNFREKRDPNHSMQEYIPSSVMKNIDNGDPAIFMIGTSRSRSFSLAHNSFASLYYYKPESEEDQWQCLTRYGRTAEHLDQDDDIHYPNNDDPYEYQDSPHTSSANYLQQAVAPSSTLVFEKSKSSYALTDNHRFIYSTGGYIPGTGYFVPCTSCLRYDILLDKLEYYTNVLIGRVNHNTIVIHDRLFLIGGRNSHDKIVAECEWIPVVEEDDESHNNDDQEIPNDSGSGLARTGSRMAPMENPRELFGICRLGKNEIMVAGGRASSNVKLTSVEVYNIETNKWRTLKSMNQPRSNFQLIAYRGAVYAIGGLKRNQRNQRGSEAVIEKYNLERNEWVDVDSNIENRVDHVVVVAVDKIYIIGGTHPETYERCRSIACFRPQARESTENFDLSVRGEDGLTIMDIQVDIIHGVGYTGNA